MKIIQNLSSGVGAELVIHVMRPGRIRVSAAGGPVGRAFRGENGSAAVVRLSGDRGLGCPGGGQCSRIVVGGSPTPVVCARVRSCISRVLRVAVWAL